MCIHRRKKRKRPVDWGKDKDKLLPSKGHFSFEAMRWCCLVLARVFQFVPVCTGDRFMMAEQLHSMIRRDPP